MPLLNDRRRTMAGTKESIPFQSVEYLKVDESCGVPYIPTDIFLEGDEYILEFDFEINGRTGNNSNIVCNGHPIKGESQSFYGIIYAGQNEDRNILCYFNNHDAAWSLVRIGKDFRVKVGLNGISRIISINGNLYDNKLRSDTYGFPMTDPICIFSDDPSELTFGKIYGVKVMDSESNVIFELTPVRVGDEGFMYDKVSGKLFGNAGSGKFILGPDIN